MMKAKQERPNQSDDDLPKVFPDVFAAELQEIRERRREAGFDCKDLYENNDAELKKNLVGLALSGGGIRSATFCLGLAQAMHKFRLLRIFDYLSTVSGGGYLGGWWSAYLARPQFTVIEIKNLDDLAYKLLDAQNPISKQLLEERFSPNITRLLKDYVEGQSVSAEELEQGLVNGLNRVLEQKSLYQASLFQNVKLKRSTRKIVNQYLRLEKSLATDPNAQEKLNCNLRLWLNRMLLQDAYPDNFDMARFPPPEGIEPHRAKCYLGEEMESDEEKSPQSQQNVTSSKLAEGSMSAGVDPLHHLRLFANYLTPKRGLFSGDTWRAIAVITRNLTMTWLILLPVLVALVLIGQLYFVLQCDNFVNSGKTVATNFVQVEAEHDSTEHQTLTEPQTPLEPTDMSHKEALIHRARIAIPPLVLIAGWIMLMGILWLMCTIETEKPTDWIVIIMGLIAVIAVLYCVISVYGPIDAQALYNWLFEAHAWIGIWVTGAIILILFVLMGAKDTPAGADIRTKRQWRREVRLNKLTQVHMRLLVVFMLTAIVLTLSGFGHDLMIYPYQFFNMHTSDLSTVAQNSGWIFILAAAVSGSIFTAYKARPAINDDKRRLREPSMTSRFIFAMTPPMVVMALAIIVSWIGHRLLEAVNNESNRSVAPLVYGSFFGIALCLAFALFEMRWKKVRPSFGLLAFVTALAFMLSLVAATLPINVVMGHERTPLIVLAVIGIALVGFLLFFKSAMVESKESSINTPLREELFVVKTDMVKGYGHLFLWIIIIACAAGAIFGGLKANLNIKKELENSASPHVWSLVLPLIVATLTGGLVLFRLFVIRKNQKRQAGNSFELLYFREWAGNHRRGALWLLGSACVVLTVATDCGIHLLITHSAKSTFVDSLPFLILPFNFAFLACGLLFFRLAANELRNETEADQKLVERPLFRSLTRFLIRFRFIIDFIKGVNLDKRDSLEWINRHRERFLALLASLCMLLSIGMGWIVHLSSVKAGSSPTSPIWSSVWSWAGALLAVGLVLFRTAVVSMKIKEEKSLLSSNWRVFKWQWVKKGKSLFLWLLASVCILLALATGWIAQEVIEDAAKEYRADSIALTHPSFICIVLCITFMIFEMKWGEGDNRRSLWLIATAYAVSVVLLVISLAPSGGPEAQMKLRLVQAVIGLVSAALAWVVGFGWMADPNAYSMHIFYRARLVRAYLGASNHNRRLRHKEITESVAGDNLLLKDMTNCKRGAPYHLINTTLNLVAARDLATAQRSAASFTLSQLYCGSARTGYRETDKYMGGLLSLGTSVAVSGAAASPNMGSRTPTASLAMLMTFLNVRLGYWAPTPKRRDWRSPRARLWPFYLLREFLSETNDVSDYCYLTDGGHFDNLGLYSLVERGCRYIIVADCGADPEPCFADLGNTIRRCRIDFRAEIKLDITPFKKLTENRAASHYIEGEIIYSKEHVKKLGWSGDVEPDEARTGKIIFFKPSLLADKKADETADVRQYSIQNNDFPQQTTTNQWFDEAQFESYRQLGLICGLSTFKELPAAARIREKAKSGKNISLQDIKQLFKDPPDNFSSNISARAVSGLSIVADKARRLRPKGRNRQS